MLCCKTEEAVNAFILHVFPTVLARKYSTFLKTQWVRSLWHVLISKIAAL